MLSGLFAVTFHQKNPLNIIQIDEKIKLIDENEKSVNTYTIC